MNPESFNKQLERLNYSDMPKINTTVKGWVAALIKKACTDEKAKAVLLVNDQLKQIKAITNCFDDDAESLFYLLSSQSLYSTDPRAETWRRLFKPIQLNRAGDILRHLKRTTERLTDEPEPTPAPDPWKAWEQRHGIKREIIQPSLFDHGDGFSLEAE